jgi:hypothetical protein
MRWSEADGEKGQRMSQQPRDAERPTRGARGKDSSDSAPSAPRSRRTLGSITQATIATPPAPQTAHDIASAPTNRLLSAPPSTSRALLPSAAPEIEKPVVIRGAGKLMKPPARHIVPRRSGPRSFIAQFMVAMIATAMVAGVLALSTPLGEAASLSAGGSIQALSGSVPWVPTPTATPKPKLAFRPPPGANPGQQAVINEIVAVFGPNYAQGALGVSKCESGYDPNAWNSYPILGSHASGVFQILYPSTWNTTSYHNQSPFNASANIHAAYQIFHRDGNSWREWQCKPSGHV